VACCYDLGNETSISIKGGEFLDNLNCCFHPKKCFVPYIYFMDINMSFTILFQYFDLSRLLQRISVINSIL
jgi:hypothetical protein